MLTDEASITLKAGSGGNGFVSFYPGKGGPSGGDGGRGGNVYVAVDRNMTNLNKYVSQFRFVADSGEKGASFTKTGADGADLTLYFPPGTEFYEKKTGKMLVLPEDGRRVLMCQGGRGGYGNEHFKSATNRAPREAEKGFPGEERSFKVIMRLIADVGLIGLPNAGKSSLLNELTKANAKTAAYPFTTLEPNLGSLDGVIIADIPGLIEGASQGKGLGIKFLKHIEKVRLLLHCVALDAPLEQMKKDYDTVRGELASFNPELTGKKEIILLTKSDLLMPGERKEKAEAFAALAAGEALPVSIHDLQAIEKLKKILLES